jgi:hypothetical protein
VTFHFPCRVEMPMDFFHGTTPHLHRKYSDHWAIQRSGAEVHDQTSFAGLEERATTCWCMPGATASRSNTARAR